MVLGFKYDQRKYTDPDFYSSVFVGAAPSAMHRLLKSSNPYVPMENQRVILPVFGLTIPTISPENIPVHPSVVLA